MTRFFEREMKRQLFDKDQELTRIRVAVDHLRALIVHAGIHGNEDRKSMVTEMLSNGATLGLWEDTE